VASTNNEAVDEGWRRCEKPVPGSVVRTGSARKNTTSYAETEAAALHALRTAPEPATNTTTAAMEVDVAADRISRIRKDHAGIATAERDLRHAGAAREEHATHLGLTVAELLEDLLVSYRA
jgi:hypothetical protein